MLERLDGSRPAPRFSSRGFSCSDGEAAFGVQLGYAKEDLLSDIRPPPERVLRRRERRWRRHQVRHVQAGLVIATVGASDSCSYEAAHLADNTTQPLAHSRVWRPGRRGSSSNGRSVWCGSPRSGTLTRGATDEREAYHRRS